MKSLGIIIPVFISVAFVTLVERKILGSIQIRTGPNTVGLTGIMQPIADGLKLFSKETIIPTQSNNLIFILAPILGLTTALVSWSVIPLGVGMVVVDWSLGLIFIMAISSISIYSMIMSGWSSNCQYSFFGSIRASAQMISYEVSLGLIILTIVISSGELNLTAIVLSQYEIWYLFPQFPAFLLFFISSLAETNRSPFDLTEGESELVSGYNTEYSAMAFALFFLAEYSHIIIMSSLTSILFLGGWLPFFNTFLPLPWLSLKIMFIIYCFVWVRGSYPRMRYDQLMVLLWKSYLPLSLGWLLLVFSIFLSWL